MKKTKVTLLTSALLMVFSMTGCTALKKMFVKKKSSYQLRKERQAKAAKAGTEALAKLKSGKASCEDIIKLAKMANKAPSKRGGYVEKYGIIASEAARCKKWDYVFRHTARINYRPFTKVMKYVEAKGYDTHTAYDKWLNGQKHPYYNVGYGNYSLTSIRGWLQKSSKKKSHCKAFASAAQRTYESVEADGKMGRVAAQYNRKWNRYYRSGFVGYLYVADCQEHIKLVRKMLTGNNWKDRSQACDIMAKWGKKSDLRRLRTIASTDAYSYFRRRNRIFPVRDMCRKAAGRVSVR
ncbi:MAG TPA: hypothetical protein DCE42_11655 [Myxococcales bacterium]|nr:hypothetical protein [Myxococcales bacterium]